MKIIERAQAPTPRFFKTMRSLGLALLAISGAILSAPVIMPAVIVTIAGYTAVAATVLSAVSQITVDDDWKKDNAQKKKNSNAK